MIRKAAITSLMLCTLFVVVYGACNQLTAVRSDVHTFFFEWERQIPFVPLFIIPYMSIDLFFIAAPFLCSTPAELQTFRRRIVACILIAALCFLLFPLKFSFQRPPLDGVLGLIFNNFKKVDLPYNEFPSLHIALRTILAATYYKHSRGIWRIAAQVWFSLIGFSTLFTYQHHVIDIAGGFVLGCVCLCLFQEQAAVERLWKPSNRRAAALYGGGSLFLIMIAWVLRPEGLLLLWPAASLAVAASAYAGIGACIYRKRKSAPDLWAWVALWPLMLGQYLSLGFYVLRSPAWSKLADRLWIGRRLTEGEARQAIGLGVCAVVDLTCEFAEPRAFSQNKSVACLALPALDLTAPSEAQLQQAMDFIDKHRSEGIVYIHCKAGYSRTAAVAGAWLLSSGRARTAEEAMALLTEARPGMIIRPEIRDLLESFAKTQQSHTQALVHG